MEFKPGVTHVAVFGKVLDDEDHAMLMKACDEMWLTEGHFTDEFERALEIKMGRRNAIMTNSGSSANLLAMLALELPRGSEVITCACAFPTTVNPIVQAELLPVFVDCEMGTWNINVELLESAFSGTTKAVIVSHTLGNPVYMDAVVDFCRSHGLHLIEDTCDAAGATYKGQKVGTFGELNTLSFYPAHQITTGEGGALLTDSAVLAKIATSYRDWGRDCWCEPGKDNTCGVRYAGEYDHKYTYSRIGYNLKSTDLQASIGISQLAKLDRFVEARRRNWLYLREKLGDLPLYFSYPTPDSNPSWFGFAFGVKDRNKFARYLDSRKIGNRPLFGGNLTRQPAWKNIPYRVAGDLKNSDYVMDNLLCIGVWPGLTSEMLDYISEVFHAYFKSG